MGTTRRPAWTNPFLICCILMIAPLGPVLADTLSVTARDDIPGPVDLVAEGWDGQGAALFSTTMTWAANDNGFSAQAITLPAETRTSTPFQSGKSFILATEGLGGSSPGNDGPDGLRTPVYSP